MPDCVAVMNAIDGDPSKSSGSSRAPGPERGLRSASPGMTPCSLLRNPRFIPRPPRPPLYPNPRPNPPSSPPPLPGAPCIPAKIPSIGMLLWAVALVLVRGFFFRACFAMRPRFDFRMFTSRKYLQGSY